jgi:hypothetical protein
MRRESDRKEGTRTGAGRRARDRILAGETTPGPAIAGRRDLTNLVLFLGDDLRESAMAVGGIESFLLRAQRLIESPGMTVEDLRKLVEEKEVLERFDLLWDALTSLRRSIARIHDAVKETTPDCANHR